MNPFLDDERVKELLAEVERLNLKGKHYSDIIDEQGCQYVDLVQQGGGVLGIALVGYTHILEEAGIRFLSLAGTSAGAINTMMIAGLGEIGKPVSTQILDILCNVNLFDFADGNPRLKSLIQRIIDEKPFKLNLFFNSLLIWRTLKKELGLNPGMYFEKWVDENLRLAGIGNLGDLQKHRQKLPKLIDRVTGDPIERQADLKIIASDITSKSKITFPEMAELYWDNPTLISPACFVRASMSIPFFFQPYRVFNIPNAGTVENPNLPKGQTKWIRHVGYRGPIPKEVSFVDGGMLSNFPIDAFHLTNGVPKKPTFGARLSTWRSSCSKTDTLGAMCGAMVSTMRQLHDYDFLLKHEDYKNLICSIDADEKLDENGNLMFNWLDFNMPKEKQIALFILGAEKALEFLSSFNWGYYKGVRAVLQSVKPKTIQTKNYE